jgi:hypothetical protein
VADFCDGVNFHCPADVKLPAGTQCRAAVDVCDVDDFCAGANNYCPYDYEPAGTVCRTAAGVCDAVETCTDNLASCPADAKLTSECRASAGECDVAEICDGVGDDCPGDVLEPASTVCRADAGACDVAENCTGLDVACPADGFELDGTPCLDADVCDGAEECLAGACTAGAPLDCDDADPCTAESCDEITGCAHDPIAFCGGDVPAVGSWGHGLLVLLLATAGVLFALERRRGVI